MTRHARHAAGIGLVLLPLCLTAAVGVVTVSPGPAFAQTPSKKAPTNPAPPDQDTKPAPYDGQMMRLAEVLGSVSYLRTLCGADGDATGDVWRSRMQRLLESDTGGEPQRRERLTAAFNRGYRSFAAVHRSCTNAARQAEQRYRNEGATLAAEIAARYGN
jgi:uncharacterized protein (TIGR02301 family)